MKGDRIEFGELIEKRADKVGGYGVGYGHIVKTTYKCPCGNGIIESVKDDVPGFRSTDTFIHCPECSSKYDVDEHHRGVLIEK